MNTPTATATAPAAPAVPCPRDRAESLTATVDLVRAQRNIERFHAAAHARGLTVRAHVKGHRTLALAVRQIEAGAVGISVTQAGQARRYLEAGITDIVIAHPWHDPWRFALFADLARDCTLAVHVDHPGSLPALAAAARAAGSSIGVLARIGDGHHATATTPADLLALAEQARSTPGLRFAGLTAYQGMTAPGDAHNRFAIGARTARYAAHCAEHLRAHGLPCPTVSVGGTPTAAGIRSVPGITEIGAGAYPLLDAGLAQAGACAPEDIAITVAPATEHHRQDAEGILAQHRYPWQPRGAVLPADGSPVPPPHICPLLTEIRELRVRGAGGRVQHWPVLNTPDTAPTAPGTAPTPGPAR
ncbi:alanine racemase [Streptacidiphilus cavernicola]|uniref:Alanine racemase n=1 Tax=Streptacidiphilus cavernicola TaxID=3342716 RepID=A0ABV6W5X9_9ACTN